MSNHWYMAGTADNRGSPGSQGQIDQGCTGGILCNTEACIAAVNAAKVCGYDDWRLPTWEELLSLVNRNFTPAINRNLFPETQSGPYWTAAAHVISNNVAWAINFQSGDEEGHEKRHSANYVRAVRNSNDAPPINLSSSDTGHAKPVTGTLSEQLDILNAGPLTFDNTWVSVKRHRDRHANNAFVCGQVSDPLTEPYLTVGNLSNFMRGVDEVTYNNCDSAFYRFTFTIPNNFAPMCLRGEANVDDQGVAFLNGHRISGAMNNPGCNPDPVNGPNDPCYAEQDVRKDRGDEFAPIMDGDREVLAWPNTGRFETCNAGYFKPGLNELVFAIAGDASYFEPTGLEFKAEVTGTTVYTGGVALSISRTGSGKVTSNPSGIDCGSLCGTTFVPNTAVTLTATPETGFTFTGWGGACSGTATTCTVTLNAAKSVTASFSAASTPTHALTITKAGTGSGTVTSNPAGISCGTDCTENYQQGATVTLAATAATGSTFAGWSGGCTGTASTCLIAMNAAQSVTATFNSAGGGNNQAATTLITHYYVSILERQPEADGLAFWLNRIAENQAQGIDVKPVFRDMANFFLNSPEYLGRNTSNSAFVHNLYRTFYQREPDAGGLAFWLEQLATGNLSRNQVIAHFLYLPEFLDFMQRLGF